MEGAKMKNLCDEEFYAGDTGWLCQLPAGHHGLHVAASRDEKGHSYAIAWSSEIEEDVPVDELAYSIDA